MKKAIPWIGGFIVLGFFTLNNLSKDREFQKSLRPRDNSIKQKKEDALIKMIIDVGDTSFCPLNPHLMNKENVSVRIYYPCRWKTSIDTLDNSVNIECHNIIGDSTFVIVSINTAYYEIPLTLPTLKNMRSDKFAISLMRKQGHQFVSRKSIDIDGMPTEEILFKTAQLGGAVMYSKSNYIYTPSQLIVVTYAVVNSNESTTKELMNRYSPLFDRLRSKIDFLD